MKKDNHNIEFYRPRLIGGGVKVRNFWVSTAIMKFPYDPTFGCSQGVETYRCFDFTFANGTSLIPFIPYPIRGYKTIAILSHTIAILILCVP